MNSSSEKHTILIIDDNPQFAEDVRALAGEEFHLITASSGEEGLRKLSECPVDLVLIDQHLQNLPWRRAYRDELQRQRPKYIGESPAVRRLFADVEIIAPTDRPVLITGESGTGKELSAHEIHRRSQRAHRPMVIVNCSNLPPDIFESEFFGHPNP
jgi:DNA-binding NtrC family response regulator